MTSKTLAPRRILIAIAITLLLGSVSVLALGEQKADHMFDVPASWGVAEPRIGDRGEYTYTLLDADGQALGPGVPYYTFHQLPAHVERDAAGEPVLVNTLHLEEGAYVRVAYDPPTYEWRLASIVETHLATDGRIPFRDLDFGALFADGEAPANTSVAGVTILQGESSQQGSFRMRFYPGSFFMSSAPDVGAGLCGLRNAMQGAELRLGHALDILASGCSVDLGGVDPSRLTGLSQTQREDVSETTPRVTGGLGHSSQFRAVGVQRIADLDALVLAHHRVEHDYWPFDDDSTELDSMRLWLARDVPYPLQVSVEQGELTHVLRLTSFERGATPLATGNAPSMPGLPAVRVAPARPWGLDDEGALANVPASAAWAAALQEGTLAAFLRDHPTAVTYAVDGAMFRNEVDGSESYDWSFRVTNGTDALQVEVSATVAPLVPLPPLLGLGVESIPGEPEYTFKHSTPDPQLVPTIDRASAPAQLPSATSLVMRWTTESGLDPALATWGLETRCVDATGASVFLTSPVAQSGCGSYEVVPYVHLQSSNMTPDASTPGQVGIDTAVGIHGASFDGAGMMLDRVDYMASRTTDYGAATPLTPGTTQVPYKPGPPVRNWVVPDAAVVAGVGFLAVLAGAFYLVWPALKGGAVGMFSRVTGSELLEHPQRQKLLTAIEAQPGIHLKELARQTGMAWGQTQHHVAKLVESGAIVAKASAGYTCYFPKGQDRHVMASAAVLKADGARRLLATIASTAGLSIGQLSRSVGLTESTAHYHLKRLEAAGLVTTHLVDGARRVTLTALGSQAGRVYGASPASSGAAA